MVSQHMLIMLKGMSTYNIIAPTGSVKAFQVSAQTLLELQNLIYS